MLCLSAFFSSSETALTIVNQYRIRSLADDGNKRAQIVLKVTENSGKMLSAILIGNNVVNISASSLATVVAVDVLGDAGAGVATGILTILILIFGEISPKTMATYRAERISLRFGPVIWIIMVVLTPVIFIVNKLAMGFLRLFGVKAGEKPAAMTESELRTIVDVGHESGIIETEEKEMINNMFDFGDTLAKEIMVPRVDMTYARLDATYNELMEIFRQDKFTRLPICEDSADDIIGILNIKDILFCADQENISIQKLMREPFFTYEQKNTAELFLEMRESSINMAIVLDEYGVTSGLITLEDLLEEIVGDIRDEYDADEDETLKQLSPTEYLVEGSMNLEDLNDILDLDLRSEDYDSVGGYMIGLLDHIPALRESVTTEDGLYFQVTWKEKNRISKIYLRIPENYRKD
ncbi:MAG: HlyC/CorC family transporter [Eubacterium sp.]|nr:HlyC/CorC family transporter [Eubacterium sp.]